MRVANGASLRPPAGPVQSGRVARRLTAAGTPISAQAIWDLRNGKTRNPRWSLVVALARFFEVPLDFFGGAGPSEAMQERQRLALALSREGVEEIARRAATLSPAGRRALLTMVDALERLEREGDR